MLACLHLKCSGRVFSRSLPGFFRQLSQSAQASLWSTAHQGWKLASHALDMSIKKISEALKKRQTGLSNCWQDQADNVVQDKAPLFTTMKAGFRWEAVWSESKTIQQVTSGCTNKTSCKASMSDLELIFVLEILALGVFF